MDGADPNQQRDLLAAVQALVSRDRILGEQELLVATISESLGSGAKSSEELLDFVNGVWAGANIPRARLESALTTAEDAGLIARADALTGEQLWALTAAGHDGVDATKGWVDETLDRTARQLQDLARSSFGELSTPDAKQLVAVLTRALNDAVKEGFAAYVGDVELLVDGTLVPRKFDRERAVSAIINASVSDPRKDLMLAALAAALDTSSSFGNELLGHLATGCVLHAYLAGQGNHRAALGTILGEEFILETPVLLSLIGTRAEAEALWRVINDAVAARTKVVVPEHCLEELLELVLTVEERHLPALRDAIGRGMRPRVYALAVDVGILQTWIAALDEGVYERWSDFRVAAAQLPMRLSDIGVEVRPHGNSTRETVEQCRQSLVTVINERGASRRGTAIQRDAETMAMALRHRLRRAGEPRAWPGSWIVTPDRQLAPAYRLVVPGDKISLTLTPPQWTTLVTRCADAPSVQQLARATAPLLLQQTAMSIATRYPPDVALDLAQTLSDAGVTSDLDLHGAQLSLDDVLDPESGVPAADDGIKLAAEVLARRTRRLTTAVGVVAARSEAERSLAVETASDATREAALQRQARHESDQAAAAKADELAQLHRSLEGKDAALSQAVAAGQVLARRRVRFATVATLVVVMVVVLAFAELLVASAALLLALLVFTHESRGWRSDPAQGLHRMWLPALISLIGVIQFVWSPKF